MRDLLHACIFMHYQQARVMARLNPIYPLRPASIVLGHLRVESRKCVESDIQRYDWSNNMSLLYAIAIYNIFKGRRCQNIFWVDRLG